MTISAARKLLGKEARNLSDEELERDILTAETLKEFFFSYVLTKQGKKPKMPTQNGYNVP